MDTWKYYSITHRLQLGKQVTYLCLEREVFLANLRSRPVLGAEFDLAHDTGRGAENWLAVLDDKPFDTTEIDFLH